MQTHYLDFKRACGAYWHSSSASHSDSLPPRSSTQTTITANCQVDSAIDPDFSSSGVISAGADATTALAVTCTSGTIDKSCLALTPARSNTRGPHSGSGTHFGVAAVLDRHPPSYDILPRAAQARPQPGTPDIITES